jgi:hypothetical protein
MKVGFMTAVLLATTGTASCDRSALPEGSGGWRRCIAGDGMVMPAAGAPSFEAAAHYAHPVMGYGLADSGSPALAMGDFDGDRSLDVAFANYAGGVSVFLNRGDGTFQARAYPVGANAGAIDVVDFDNDGKRDLVTTLHSPNTTPLPGSASLLRGNGDGTFEPAVALGDFGFSLGVATGDLDADGKPDLAFANIGGTNAGPGGVTVLMNAGGGAFAPAVDYHPAVLPDPSMLKLGDVDGDGKPDLFLPMYIHGTFVMLNAGDGSFGEPALLAGEPAVLAYGVGLGDLNGDGRLDAVTVADSHLSVFSNGGTSLAPAVTYEGSLDTGWRLAEIADMNGDCSPDLVLAGAVGGGDGINVLTNPGSGVFGESGQLPALAKLEGDLGLWIKSIAVGDLNGDGKPDIVAATQDDLVVFLNRTP